VLARKMQYSVSKWLATKGSDSLCRTHTDKMAGMEESKSKTMSNDVSHVNYKI
jgi:hypothetical protein